MKTTKATPAKRESLRGSLPTVVLQNASRSRRVPQQRSIRRWAGAALRLPACVTVRVVGTAEGLRLNHAWRGRAYATNVLSFGYGRSDGRLQGDLVLCASVVASEARRQRKPLAAHYAHLIVHGLLHLQGYDHEREDDAVRMQRRERMILKGLGFADPYAEPEAEPKAKPEAKPEANPKAAPAVKPSADARSPGKHG